jgi:hypothetical protein
MKMFLLISQNLFLKNYFCLGCEESHLMLDTGSAFWLLLGHL